ncbi:MAG: hypothetical protein WAN35_17275 [Terracidiphilus sp.]
MGLLFSKNGPAFIISSLIGFVVARYLFEGPWATYAYILISYHVFLAWLVITAEHETGFSMPIFSTIVTHLACVTVVVGVTYGRHYIPFFGLIRYFIPAMAPFERDWVFKGSKKTTDSTKTSESTEKKEPVKRAPAVAAIKLVSVDTALSQATLDDHDAWLRHLSQPNRPHKRAGLSVREEYEQWLVARISARQVSPPSDSPA